MDRSDASALADLQMHWDEAYAIGLDGDIWLATFHGSTDELRAHTSTELRELIRADYAYRQHVRRVRPAAARTEEAGEDEYAAHFDHTQIDRGSPGSGDRHDTEADRQAGLSRGPLAQGGYANLHGERMST